MSGSPILLNIEDDIAVITLNRPEAMNVWNQTMSR